MEDKKITPYAVYMDDDEAKKTKFHYYDESNPQEKNRNIFRNLIFLLPLAAFLVIGFFSVCLLIRAKRAKDVNFSEQRAVMTYLENNQNKELWEECKAIQKSDDCPADYKIENIGKFSGYKDGCICKDGSVHSHSYCQTQTETHCQWYSGTAGKDMTFWKIRKFCLKKVSDWKLLKPNEDCSAAGMLKCGNYCLKSTKCPITRVQLVPRQPMTFMGVSFLEERSNFDVNKDLVITREADSPPVVGLVSKVSDFPCAAFDEKNPQPASGIYYPLEKIPHSGCGKYGSIEESSNKLDTNLDIDYLKDNSVWDSISNAPFIDKFANAKDYFNLYSLHKVPVKPDDVCKKINPSSTIKLENSLNKSSHNLYLYCVCLFIISLIGGVFSMAFILAREKLEFLNNRGALIVIFILLLACAIISVIMYAHYKSQERSPEIQGAVENYKQMSAEGCFTQANFKQAADDIVKGSTGVSKSLDWLLSNVMVTALVFTLAIFGLMFVRGCMRLSWIPEPKL